MTYGRNIDNIAGNEKIIAEKENVTVTYTRLIFDCYAFVINFKVTYINIFFYTYLLLKLKVMYIEGDL